MKNMKWEVYYTIMYVKQQSGESDMTVVLMDYFRGLHVKKCYWQTYYESFTGCYQCTGTKIIQLQNETNTESVIWNEVMFLYKLTDSKRTDTNKGTFYK